MPHTGASVTADGHLVEPNADDFRHARSAPKQRDWYKTAVFYEVLVRAFNDFTNDGTGDLRGLADKLDYLQWLGVDCLWLPPFYASPLRDGGYDISDFRAVLPEFGTVEDFVYLLDQAHRRGLRVITDLVLNHTSDAHPWFQESRQHPDGPYGDYYVWSDTDEGVPGRADHLRRHRDVELDLRPGARPVLLAPVLHPPAGPQLREPRGPGRDDRRPAVLAGPRHRRLPARRGPLPVRGGGHQLREPAAHARVPQALPQGRRRRVPRPGAARRGQPVAGGRGRSTSATRTPAATSATWRSTSR